MKEKTTRIGDRINGLVYIAFGGIIATGGTVPLEIGATLFITEGLGDLISGEHHYLGSRVIKYLSRGKINITNDYNK